MSEINVIEESKDSIKVIKNTRGYTYEIKYHGDLNTDYEMMLKKVDELRLRLNAMLKIKDDIDATPKEY